jgi:alanine racemase
VTLVGAGLPLEEHARVAGTITYELACGIGAAAPNRATRRVVGA